MKCITIILISSAVILLVEGSVMFMERNEEKLKDRPNECYSSEVEGNFMKAGERKLMESACGAVVCRQDGGTENQYCGAVYAIDSSSEIVPGNPALDYPACCPKVVHKT